MSVTRQSSGSGERAPGAGAEEFEDFVAGAQRELRRLCWALTGDRGLGEDLAQTTLEKVWRRWPSIEGDPVAYARKVAVNESVSWKRRWAWHREIVRDVAGDGEALAAADGDGSDAAADRLGVEQWLAGLPARYRAVVVLRYLLDMSIEETAAALDCSPGTVKSRSSRALNQLRAGLEADGTVEAPTGAAPIRSTPAVRGGQS